MTHHAAVWAGPDRRAVAGYLTRRLRERAKDRQWYEATFLPKIGPVALYGLLFTIVILFALQGDAITSRPWDVALIAVPLLAYFADVARRQPPPGIPTIRAFQRAQADALLPWLARRLR